MNKLVILMIFIFSQSIFANIYPVSLKHRKIADTKNGCIEKILKESLAKYGLCENSNCTEMQLSDLTLGSNWGASTEYDYSITNLGSGVNEYYGKLEAKIVESSDKFYCELHIGSGRNLVKTEGSAFFNNTVLDVYENNDLLIHLITVDDPRGYY